jgi:hypothetical protein
VERTKEYNISGTPTAWFDGGYLVEAGGAPGTKDLYKAAITSCEGRKVADIDIDLDVYWRADAKLDIAVSVQNNEPLKYDGHIRVYVTEIESSLGWDNDLGTPYDFPLLEYAFNQSITIPASGSWEESTLWDGALYNSGFGQTYDSIQMDNVQVIAAVFNDEWHQGYSLPPSGFPFDAYYVDDAAAATPENSLWGDVYTVSQKGGSVNLSLCAGKDKAFRPYLIVGGVSGTEPGTKLPGGLILPVTWDPFSDVVMSLVNSAVFFNFMGILNSSGEAAAQLNAPPLPPGYVGTIMYYAFCVGSPFDFVSNPIEVEIVY